MTLEIILIIVSVLCLLLGFLGTFVPVLPGAPLAWLGLLAAYFNPRTPISLALLIICGVVALAVSVLDNIFPLAMTKQSGGSKAGTTGATLGLIAGFFIGPVGIILGPFAGAFIGEIIHDSSDIKKCLKAALGAFKGFLLGTGLKMIAVAFFIWIYILALIK
ncbi:MAG: DUF456 domain-containing protein [Treponema sp.]|nr:DUF456 domain-containing protein [Treponema sp.]